MSVSIMKRTKKNNLKGHNAVVSYPLYFIIHITFILHFHGKCEFRNHNISIIFQWSELFFILTCFIPNIDKHSHVIGLYFSINFLEVEH